MSECGCQIADIKSAKASHFARLGPARAVGNLIAFWRARYPTVVFGVDMPPDSFGPAINERISRIVQESLNNALRHGRPQHIAIAVRLNADGIITVDTSDDGIGFQTSDGAGFGLLGMRERVQSLGDTRSARNRADKIGVIVTAQPTLLCRRARKRQERQEDCAT
jgi:two-component system, NarL family, sensor histidine kinase UhpB